MIFKTMIGLHTGLDRLNGWIAALSKLAACVLIVLIAVAVFGGVVMRYVFNTPLEWQEEFPKFAMVWMTFIGAVFVYRQREHISLDMLPDALTPRLASFLKLLICICVTSVLVVFIKYGMSAAEAAKAQRIILLESLSLFWVYLAVPLGSSLLILAVAQDLLRHLLETVSPGLLTPPD